MIAGATNGLMTADLEAFGKIKISREILDEAGIRRAWLQQRVPTGKAGGT